MVFSFSVVSIARFMMTEICTVVIVVDFVFVVVVDWTMVIITSVLWWTIGNSRDQCDK